MDAPTLLTQRLIIKPLKINDADMMFRYRADPLVYRFQSWKPSSLEEVEEFIKNYSLHGFAVLDTWFQLGIYLQPTGELIGDIGLHFLKRNSRSVEIGYTIAPYHQRNGYAYEATDSVIRFLSERMKINKIFAAVIPENQASTALLLKLGAREAKELEQKAFGLIQDGDRLFIIQMQP